MTHIVLDGRHDSRALRHALGRFPTGVTVITARTPAGKREGMTANSFAALSLDPPLVLWSINRNAQSLQGFIDAGHFAINVLAADQAGLSHRFATPQADKYAGVAYTDGLGGSPVLDGVLASFECCIENTVDGGDHLLFIGRVLRIGYGDGDPLIFNAGQYCTAVAVRKASAEGDLNDVWEGLG